MLKELLNEDLIDVKVPIKNWEEAIRYGGGLLKNGIVEDEYIELMISSIHEYGPYIVLAPGIAMPHATSKIGVNEIGISLITLKDPINFGHKENDPVSLVVTLATVDPDSHIDLLSELVGYLGKEGFLEKVTNATTAEEVLELLDSINIEEE